MPKIVIELRSDLCVASGEGFASIINTDVCYDKRGIPYIPSRRLKGVLREAADFIEMDTKKRDKIFGISGNEVEGNLRFSSDALLSDYKKICEELSGESFEQVLDIFTYTRVATRIDEDENIGVAKENTLRFNRVVKQYSPINEERLKFIASCDIDEEYREDLKEICGALRSVGYNRNRGLGAVKCTLEVGEAEKNSCIEAKKLKMKDNRTYKIPIYVTNTSPMVITSMNNNETENYIPGTALLGALAWRYENKQSDEFKELFLQENVIFSNLYVGGKVAPLCYAKLKQEDIYVNFAKLSKMDKDKLKENDMPKPLKESYIDAFGNINEIEKEVIYHYNTKETLLYMQTALSAGQTFVGSITGKGKYLKKIWRLIKGNKIRLGKSKTAQYSNCVIECGFPQKNAEQTITIKEDKVAVVLQSDVILINEGANDCGLTALLSSLQERMSDDRVKLNVGTVDRDSSSLSYRTVGGYSGIWNLKKPHMKTIKAGSAIIFDKVTGKLPAEVFIGAKINEGFGHCEIMKVSEMPQLKKISNKRERSNVTSEVEAYKKIIEKRNDEKECRRKALAFADENKLPSNVTSSQIGRVQLMLKQSKNECDFKRRLTAIKTEAVQKALVEYIDKDQLEGGKEKRDDLEYKLFWDTVFRVHRYKRKIMETSKGGKAGEENNIL